MYVNPLTSVVSTQILPPPLIRRAQINNHGTGCYSQHRINNLRVLIHDLMHNARMIWWINYNFNWVRWLDDITQGEYEMAMKERGVERSKTKGNAQRFFNLHFLDQKWSKDLEFALAKLRGLCKYLASVYISHSHVYGLHRLILCMKTKQKNQCNEASRPLKELSVVST